MLLLLLLAKGWAVTRLELTWKPLVILIWLIYSIVNILLYVWNMVSSLVVLILKLHPTSSSYYVLTIFIYFFRRKWTL